MDISGGMIVGELGSKLNLPDNVWLWVEDNSMITMSTKFDCSADKVYFGYFVEDVPVYQMDSKWLETIRDLADKFKGITGVDARLIGAQDVT